MPSVLAAARSQANRTAHDLSLTPAERVRALRRLRDRHPELEGDVGTYIGGLELQREAEAIARAEALRAAREDAEVREELIRRGDVTAEELDAAGLRSHADLDALEAEGTLGEVLMQEAAER